MFGTYLRVVGDDFLPEIDGETPDSSARETSDFRTYQVIWKVVEECRPKKEIRALTCPRNHHPTAQHLLQDYYSSEQCRMEMKVS